MKLNIKNIFLLIIFFLYLFNPPISVIPISPSMFFSLFAILFLLRKADEFIRMYILVLTSLFFVLIYSATVDIVDLTWARTPIANSYSFITIRFIVEVVLLSFCFLTLIKEESFKSTNDKFIFFIKILVFIQVFISILMISNFSIKEFVFFDMMRFDSEDKITSPEFFMLRGFGFASGYLFEFPVLLGFISALLLNNFIYSRKLSDFIFSVLALLVGLINARTAIIPLLSLLCVRCVLLKIRLKDFFSIIFYLISFLVISFLIVFYFFPELISDLENTINWIAIGLVELSSGEGATFDNLEKHQMLPNSLIEILLGSGFYINQDGLMSDIGYVHYIYFGGVVFLLLNFLVFVKPFMCGIKGWRRSDFANYEILFLSSILSICLIMYKGRVFLPNGFTKLLFIMLGFYIYFNGKYNKGK